MAKLFETINAENWIRDGTADADSSKWCLAGHLIKRGSDASNESVNAAVLALFPDRVNPFRPYPLVCFNDHPDTTLDDILRVAKLADV